MKQHRQERILEIITEKSIDTQEQLLEELRASGINCTQATISRDIKTLRIVKELSPNGTYRYSVPKTESSGSSSERLNTIFRECAKSCDHAQNLLVIKTLPGLAPAAASAVDSMNLTSVVGTLAGDDTVLIILRDTQTAAALCAELRKLIRV